MRENVSPERPVICWFSGGVTSAVACKLAIGLFGKDNCRSIFIDTMNEDEDSYRFLYECEDWFEVEIEKISHRDFQSIEEVWREYRGLNFAKGAICSTVLKREVREEWQKENTYSYQVFGYDIDEPKRAKAFTINHHQANPIYPLMLLGYSKKKCIDVLQEAYIDIPRAYAWGFLNNNCLKTGCVQGGIGYWQKIGREAPHLFDKMARMEHELTDLKGEPVTMLKDQSKSAKKSGNQLVFLRPHPDYPNLKDISKMKGRPPKPLIDCNGYCGITDLEGRNPTEDEINRM